MLISEAFELYCLDCIVAGNQSRKTEENHYICMRALIAYFTDVHIESLDRRKIRDWKISLDVRRSPATVRNYIIKLRVVLKYLKQDGHAVVDYDTIPVPKRVEKIPEYLSAEQVSTVIASTKRIKNKAMVALLYASGIRISEMCNMNISDLKDGMFTVIGKGGYARLCFFDERAKIFIELYLESRTDNNPALFLTDKGERMRPGVLQDTFRSIRKVSSIKCHPHTLRHSYATNLLLNNANMRYVQVMLGHKSLATTAIYAHVADPDLERIYREYHTY